MFRKCARIGPKKFFLFLNVEMVEFGVGHFEQLGQIFFLGYVALKWHFCFVYCIVHEFKLITKCTSFVNQSTMTQSKENIQ